jgi:non-ribosomal peptide synthetase component F
VEQLGVLRGGQRTPPARTLVDVLEQTTRRCPDALALDDGRRTLTYAELAVEVAAVVDELAGRGVGRGDRVGVRLPSGTVELYVAVLGVLHAGACYVPVDVDDPPERAALVLREAGVRTVLGEPGTAAATPGAPGRPSADDDAWVIFTSGSTGTPKGVAVTHRSAAAFVDAEARLFLQEAPLGTDDRVLAGLSVAFDASCEEMWLAWRSGACLVPAPRALVRSGMDLGPWLVASDITVVSTVPTLAALWPAESLESVRLLVFGGEACPPELAERLAVEGREVWNTYGPTEATVVACAARLTGDGPVRIGLPLDGWDLAVVDASGAPAAEGELVIGGVGLARYLDPAKDAERFGPLPSLGWERAYRSGDLVRYEAEGCCSSAARTTRSSWAAGASSWARWTRRCRRCRTCGAARRRCRRHRAAAPCWSATSSPTRASTSPRRWAGCAPPCRPRSCRSSRRSTRCRPGPPARSTGPPCRGRCRPRATAGCWRARRAGWPSSGRPCSARRWADRTRTSSPTAAAAWPPPSSWPACAAASRP